MALTSSITPTAAGLRALSHPTRLRMLKLLRIEGAATATQLAGRLGLNTGATSYHLRQLAEHGFIVEDPDRQFRGRVTEVSWLGEPTRPGRPAAFKVLGWVANPGAAMRSGMTGRARIDVRPDTLLARWTRGVWPAQCSWWRL